MVTWFWRIWPHECRFAYQLDEKVTVGFVEIEGCEFPVLHQKRIPLEPCRKCGR